MRDNTTTRRDFISGTGAAGASLLPMMRTTGGRKGSRLSEQARSTGNEPFFPFAVWYGGGKARAPMLEPDPERRRATWRADVRKIKDLGFNTVRCWMDWSTGEPSPEHYDFRPVRQILDLAHEVGLKVIVQVYPESAPEWVGVQYPDSAFVASDGYVVPSQSAPGYCLDHPEVRRKVRDFYTALAREVRDQPAFYGWDVWSEPHVISWVTIRYLTNPEFCYCPNTMARFRQWLQSKYHTLGELNRVWYRRFDSWSQVEPPRFSTILSYSDYIDWRQFIQDKLAGDLKMKAEAVLAEAPRGVVTSHAAGTALFTNPMAGHGNPDDWKMARVIQYWGASFYPKHSSPTGLDVVLRGARLDFSKSAGYRYSNGFYLGEVQAGFGTVGLRVSAPVTATDLTQWTWSAIARGVKGLCYYAFYPMSSGYESGGFGLIHLDGHLTERSKVLGNIGKVVRQNANLFLRARPSGAQVAIMYNPLAYMVGGPRRLPLPGAQDEYAGVERSSWIGVYRALFYQNVPIDFVHADDIAENGVGNYKLLYVPYPIMMRKATARAITRFVEQGGHVVMEARAAWNDDRGWATPTIPGFGFDRIFGAREISVIPVHQTELVVKSGDASLPLLDVGATLPGMIYQESLETVGPKARVIAQFPDGSAAAIVRRDGRGRTLYLGSYLSMAFEKTRDHNLGRFFQGLLSWAGVDRPVSVSSPLIEVRSLDGPGFALYFLFNNAEEETLFEVKLRPPFIASTVRDVVAAEGVPHQTLGGEVTLKKNLKPQGVCVLEFQEKA